jgi:hypothetical protein
LESIHINISSSIRVKRGDYDCDATKTSWYIGSPPLAWGLFVSVFYAGYGGQLR